MMRHWLLPTAILLAAAPAAAKTDLRAQIETVMADSAAGWNEGDVDRFLKAYSDDPATSFTTSRGVERGKPGIRARYLKSYAKQFGSDASGRSTLSFAFEEVRPIGGDHALLIARWTLTPASGAPQSGLTSLLFRKEPAGWRIVADHSS